MKPKLTELTPEQKRILCAEACGWTRCACGDTEHCDVWYKPDEDATLTIGVSPYDTSLDAMAEAEATLECTEAYESELIGTCQNTPIWHATAPQRLDAFLLAKGLAE